MSCYSHLTINKRESILVMHEKGESMANIAQILNRSKATISRELKRNSRPRAGYSACYAQKRYEKRRRSCCRKRRLEEPATRERVIALLDKYWSPEQICERLRMEAAAVQIGASTIYRGIRNGLLPREMKTKLRAKPYHKPKGSRTGKLVAPHSIHERPEAANRRDESGHWESDTVRGRFHSGYIMTHVDRKSRYLVAAKILNACTRTYMDATICKMAGLPTKTFTTDNGKEFAAHARLTQELSAEVYFCDPAAPLLRSSGARTKTPTVCFASSSRSAAASRGYRSRMSTELFPFSTTGQGSAWVGAALTKSFSPNRCT